MLIYFYPPAVLKAPPIYNGRPFINADTVNKLATAIIAAIAITPLLLTAQVPMKVATGSFILENILVDPFMADRDSAKRLKPQADLFRTPVQIEQLS